MKGAITVTGVCDDNAARKTDKENKAVIPLKYALFTNQLLKK